MDQYKLLRMAALAAKWKEPARDALDTLVLTTADLPSLDEVEQIDYIPFDPTTKRTEGTLKVRGWCAVGTHAVRDGLASTIGRRLLCLD